MGGHSKSSNTKTSHTTDIGGTTGIQGSNSGFAASGVNGNVNVTMLDKGAVNKSLEIAGKVAVGVKDSSDKTVSKMADVSRRAMDSNAEISRKSIENSRDALKSALSNNQSVISKSLDNNQKMYKGALSSANSAVNQSMINARDSRKWAGDLAKSMSTGGANDRDNKFVYIAGAAIAVVGLVLTTLVMRK